MEIERKVDVLGRVVIPAEIRKACDIEENDALFITTDGKGNILMKKAVPSCVICRGQSELVKLGGKHICRKCAETAMK